MEIENLEVNTETPTDPVVETPAETPVVVPETEIVYEYQAVDDLGRPLGAKQVFKGKTHQEIVDKVAEANKNLIKLNRELNRKNRLGEFEKEEIPDDADRLTYIEFKPRSLSEDERASLSRDLLDPEKFDDASDRLFEAKFGANPKEITNVLTKTQQDLANLRAQEEAKLFVRNNPEYYICPENFKTMQNWMLKNNLAPTAVNFQLAFDRLKAVGLLLEAPIVREEPPAPVVQPQAPVESPANSQPGPDTTSRITSEQPQTQPKRTPKVASGLTRDIASDNGAPSKSGKLTVAEIEKMPSDVLKKRILTEPGFQKAVDEAYANKK